MAKDSSSRTAALPGDSAVLSKNLEQVHSMVIRVQKYVRGVLENEDFEREKEVGRELLQTLSLAPRVDAVELERMFNSHLQDVLMVVYLSNLVRSQFDVANRLALVVS